MSEQIIALGCDRIAEYADVIRKSFADVAKRFNLTPENAPLHTSFITNERLAARYVPSGGYYPFGAAENGTIVGFISLSLTDAYKNEYELNNFCVLPEYRGRKLAKRLMDTALERARSLGAKRVFLTMIYENEALREWYTRYGFSFVRTKREAGKPFTVGEYEILL